MSTHIFLIVGGIISIIYIIMIVFGVTYRNDCELGNLFEIEIPGFFYTWTISCYVTPPLYLIVAGSLGVIYSVATVPIIIRTACKKDIWCLSWFFSTCGVLSICLMTLLGAITVYGKYNSWTSEYPGLLNKENTMLYCHSIPFILALVVLNLQLVLIPLNIYIIINAITYDVDSVNGIEMPSFGEMPYFRNRGTYMINQ